MLNQPCYLQTLYFKNSQMVSFLNPQDVFMRLLASPYSWYKPHTLPLAQTLFIGTLSSLLLPLMQQGT